MQMLLRFLQTVEHFFCLRFVEAVSSKKMQMLLRFLQTVMSITFTISIDHKAKVT